MAKKKEKKKKKRQDTLQAGPEEERNLKGMLDDLKSIDLSQINKHFEDPRLVQFFVERLPLDDPDSVPLLLAIQRTFDQKGVQKAVKKAFFKLKQKGITIPDSDAFRGAPILRTKTDQVDPIAYIGPIDGLGSRALFVALPQVPKGYDIGMGVVNDERGLEEFVSGRYSKKRMKDVKDLFFDNVQDTVETTIKHATSVLEEAYACNEPGQNDASRGYLQLRPWILENVSQLERPIIYDVLPSTDVTKDLLTHSQIIKLLNHRFMGSWVTDPESIKPVLEEIQKAEESPIFISEDQKIERINEIKSASIATLYPDKKRILMKNRLEETAFILFKRGEEEYMKLSLAAALSLDDEDPFLGGNPFLSAVIEKSIDFFRGAAEEMGRSKVIQEAPTSKIITP